MEATSSLSPTGGGGQPQQQNSMAITNQSQSAATGWVATWQTQADKELRDQIIRHVYAIFAQKKPAYQGNVQKITEFSKRVEEMLYKSAKSKEEYANLETVEGRIKELLKTYMQNNNARAAQQQQAQLLQHQNAMMLAGQSSLEAPGLNMQQQMMMQPTMQGMMVQPQPATLNGIDSATMMIPTNTTADDSLATAGDATANGTAGPTTSLGTGAQVPAAYMSNGAPVLLRGAGPITSGQLLVTNGAQQQAMPQLQAVFQNQQQQQQLMQLQSLQQQQQQQHLIKLESGGMVPMMPMMHQHPMGNGMMSLMDVQDPAAQQQAMMAMQMPQQQAAAQFIPIGAGEPQPAMSDKEGSLAKLLKGGYSVDEVGTSGGGGGPYDAQRNEARKQQILKQQRWLLFLRHCAKCQVPESECQYGGNCSVAKQLWQHLINCKDTNCMYPRCSPSRELLKHHQKCQSPSCPVCAPVKQYVSRQKQMHIQRKLASVSALTPEQKRQLVLQAQQKRLLAQQQQQGGADAAAGAAVMIPNQAGSMDPNAPIIDTYPAKRPRTLLQENMGTSLVEYFDQETIVQHMQMLKLEVTLNPPKAKPLPALDGVHNFLEDESSCKVCGANRMTFEPPSLYCFLCGQRIKRNQTFYCTPSKSEVKGHWCHGCYSQTPGESLNLDTFTIRKTELEKRKNDDETEESWVQCDRCEAWVHQICGLFNKGRNDDSRGYFCPTCLLHGLQRGERSLPSDRPQAWLSARDLPKCDLSDFLEQRLETILTEERILRAKTLGRSPNDIPTAEGLTVRVVNNVVKKGEVKPRFLESFAPSGYPDSFMYKQKVILLFQQIEGVDMCLFCLYVQEYGDDAAPPNRKAIYLSYLDSIKYFQPENVEAANRQVRLRTLVYHELLAGYLKYAKGRGYASMYIWACPPLQGDDYIMYCHPGKQKTPSSKLLREWYLAMLRHAKDEGTVVHLSNMFDTFFEDGKDHWLEKPSITNLPYLDGDYWPGEAENLLANLGDEMKIGGKGGNKARKTGKDKRIRVTDGSTDGQLLARLGSTIQGIREDFIVVHMYHNCSMCRQYISGDSRFYHPNPPQKVVVKAERTFDGISLDKPGDASRAAIPLMRFQLCRKCKDREAGHSLADGLPPRGLPAGIELTDLVEEACPEIPSTSDSVPEIENEFFDTRNAFLSLCQGNHFQFDTVRRARHSSMMVLYHLHNPSEPAFSCTCNICNCEIGPHDGGFRCTVCSDFDMCARCHINPAVTHPHPLAPHNRKDRFDETRMRLTEAERKERTKQLHRTMALLVHASACPGCSSANCQKVKALFNHAYTCKIKIGGGCAYCRRMWALLQAHAKMCTATECPVPRCKELRSLRRQQASRQEDKRRAAYRAMLLQNNDANKQQ